MNTQVITSSSRSSWSLSISTPLVKSFCGKEMAAKKMSVRKKNLKRQNLNASQMDFWGKLTVILSSWNSSILSFVYWEDFWKEERRLVYIWLLKGTTIPEQSSRGDRMLMVESGSGCGHYDSVKDFFHVATIINLLSLLTAYAAVGSDFWEITSRTETEIFASQYCSALYYITFLRNIHQ